MDYVISKLSILMSKALHFYKKKINECVKETGFSSTFSLSDLHLKFAYKGPENSAVKNNHLITEISLLIY